MLFVTQSDEDAARGCAERASRARFLERRPRLKRVARRFCPRVNRSYSGERRARALANSWPIESRSVIMRSRGEHVSITFVGHARQWARASGGSLTVRLKWRARSVRVSVARESSCHRESLPVYTRRGYLSWRSLPRGSSFLHSRDILAAR